MSLREKLISESIRAMKKSYNPYSSLKVGASLYTKNHKIFSGCNIENVSFGLTICAERVAVFNAISKGYQKFTAMAISSSSRRPIYPCGACRQVLLEFGPDMQIYINHDDGNYTAKDLLPHSFDKII